MVRKLGQSTLLQLVKVDFQWFDVRGCLPGLFQVHDCLCGHFQLIKLPRTIDNFEYKSVCMLKTPQMKLTTFQVIITSENQLFGSCAGSDLQAIRVQHSGFDLISTLLICNLLQQEKEENNKSDRCCWWSFRCFFHDNQVGALTRMRRFFKA